MYIHSNIENDFRDWTPWFDYESPLGARSFMRHPCNAKQSSKSRTFTWQFSHIHKLVTIVQCRFVPSRRCSASECLASGPGPVRSTNGHLSDDNRFNELQSQLTSIETARAADAARLACWFFQHFLWFVDPWVFFCSICRLSPSHIPLIPHFLHYLRLFARLLLHQVDHIPPCFFPVALITISDAKAAADRLAREVAKQGFQSLEWVN